MDLHSLDPAIRDAMLSRLAFPSIFQSLRQSALVVDSSALDPATLVQRTPPRDGFCLKWGGTDFGGQESFKKTFNYIRSQGMFAGAWVYCGDWATDDCGALLAAAVMTWPRQPDYVIFDAENNYKRNGDAGDGFFRAQALVEAWSDLLKPMPAAFTSYGKADTEMDLATFLLAGWPVLAQCYDAFKPGDEHSYLAEFWPASQVFPMVRTLKPAAGQSIYRPEGLDP